MSVRIAETAGIRIYAYLALPMQAGYLETTMENTMKSFSRISNNRMLLVLCALGFLCANSTLVMAEGNIPVGVAFKNGQSAKANNPKTNHPGEVKTSPIVGVEGINTGAKANNPKTNPSSPASSGLGTSSVIIPTQRR